VAGEQLAGFDPGAPARKKKEAQLEAQKIVDGILTTDHYMVRVLQARKIHQMTGQALWPWEVDSLPTDWKDAMLELANATPTRKT
jgi:hypothetical protein